MAQEVGNSEILSRAVVTNDQNPVQEQGPKPEPPSNELHCGLGELHTHNYQQLCRNRFASVNFDCDLSRTDIALPDFSRLQPFATRHFEDVTEFYASKAGLTNEKLNRMQLHVFKNLIKLSLAGNPDLTTFPVELVIMKRLPKLKYLNLSGNLRLSLMSLFNRLPEEIEPHESLEELHLSQCPLKSTLSEALFRLFPNLKKLDLSNCALSALPEQGYDQLRRLEEINLNNNKLYSIPVQLDNRWGVKILAECNRLQDLEAPWQGYRLYLFRRRHPGQGGSYAAWLWMMTMVVVLAVMTMACCTTYTY